MLNTRSTAADIARQFARLVANYGDTKIADHRQERLLVREWEEAFSHLAPATLHQAVSKCIKDCVFWPTVAEVSKAALSLRREIRTEYERAVGIGYWRAEETEFCQEGRTKAEEIAKRVADLKRFRSEAGFSSAGDDEGAAAPRDPIVYDVRVSDLSAVTRHSCAGRGARGLPTCGVQCPARDCALRRSERSAAAAEECQ